MTPAERQKRLRAAVDAARQSRFEIALSEARAVAEASPQDVVSAGFVGAIYAEIGLRDRAREWFTHARKLDPSNPLVLQQMQRMEDEDAKGQTAT